MEFHLGTAILPPTLDIREGPSPPWHPTQGPLTHRPRSSHPPMASQGIPRAPAPTPKVVTRRAPTPLGATPSAQGAPRDPRRDSRGERSPWLPLAWFGEESEGGRERQLQEKRCGQRRGMCQARTGEGVLWGGVNGQEEFARWPLELLRGSQAPRRAVCGTRGSLRTMHGGGSAPSCCAFTHRAPKDSQGLSRVAAGNPGFP